MKGEYRVLILGAGGFVGSYLRLALEERLGDKARLLSTSLRGNGENVISLDVTDIESVSSVLKRFRPSHIVNLAGLAAPSRAHADPQSAWILHAHVPYLLGRAVLETVPDCWLLHVGSGLVYGRSALYTSPLSEENLLAPTDTYSVTKASGDLAVGALAGEGLKCLRLRPFNHTGPGQTQNFAVPSFAAQLAQIVRRAKEPYLRVGNLDSERDFLDVRDVARAYTDLIVNSDNLTSGEAYNISSGRVVSMKSIVEFLVKLSGIPVSIFYDPARQRPSDVPSICGNPTKLRSNTSWRPSYSLEQTLTDTFNHQLLMCSAADG